MTIPRDYTACEVYAGITIAIKDSWYKGFNAAGEPLIGIGPEKTRAAVRKSIDLIKPY